MRATHGDGERRRRRETAAVRPYNTRAPPGMCQVSARVRVRARRMALVGVEYGGGVVVTAARTTTTTKPGRVFAIVTPAAPESV